LVDVEKRRADRLRVMKAIYDTSDGSEYTLVSGPQLLEDLGLPDQELADACLYLEGEHLITSTHTSWGHATPFHIQITHWGIREIWDEASQAPGQDEGSATWSKTTSLHRGRHGGRPCLGLALLYFDTMGGPAPALQIEAATAGHCRISRHLTGDRKLRE
jgi:hypothetical protein